MNIKIDQNLLSHDLQTLSGISAAPAPAVTRIVFSSTDLKGRDFVKHLCVQAGLAVREDPVGNTLRWPPDRISTRFRTPACTTELWAFWAD
jgi:ureidoglycolate amidohydrolase